jgi:hypothetical protein
MSWAAFTAQFHARICLVALCVFASVSLSYGQSTFGTVLGSVKDPSARVVPGAKIELVKIGTNAVRSTESRFDGSYQFVNVDVGTYHLRVDAPGFQTTELLPFDLTAHETKRIDLDLRIAAEASNLTVAAVAVVQTDTSNVTETKGSLELTDLPVAITTRSTGSTSAFSTLTAQPGVQTDGVQIIVAGATPSQLSSSIDGISSVGPGYSLGPLIELFPSFNAIEEIKISETLNPAEYGGVADITTVTKSGTNAFHGGAFENLQNDYFNASDTFSHETTTIRLNNFGAYLGGPVVIPKVYNGHNKTFFFGSYEVLRLPKSLTAILSVPTQALRNGNLSAYLDPSLGGADNQLTGYSGNIIPKSELSPYAQKLLDAFYPLPNYGPPGAIANNYLASYAIPTNSAQGDIRIDELISPKHLVYARYTYKNRRILYPPLGGSPLLGNVSAPQIYNTLAVAYNWVISSSLVNELRTGFSATHSDVKEVLTSQQTAEALGLAAPPLPGPLPPRDTLPTLDIAGLLGFQSPAANTNPRDGTNQVLDTLTWSRQKHTMKFGGDFRYLHSFFAQDLDNLRLGGYLFNGSALGALLGYGAATPLASFLLGFPDATFIASVLNPNADTYSKHYAFFGQDDWKISHSLTLNFGLRWEYHPNFHDKNDNLANFDPYYTSVQNGQVVRGAVILPDRAGFANVNSDFPPTIAPIPIITAAQAGVPKALRFSSKADFAPRIGFAWRVFGNNKTVLRGGYGRYIEALLSTGVIDGWGVASVKGGFFPNSLGSNGKPVFQFPYSFPANLSQPGAPSFNNASEIHYKDPIVEEWNLTLERDLGKGVGVRASYDGNHSYNLGAFINLNQLPPNTMGFDALATQVPFPLLSNIMQQTPLGFGNYQAGTISVRKRSRSLQFEASYVYTRNLTNIGYVPFLTTAPLPNEFGGVLSDPYNPGLDYGNTPFSRRHRFLTTFLYELPFGRGKTLLSRANGMVDRIVGGWVLSGIALFQSGPFMTVATFHDPSGTGYNLFNFGFGGRADTVPDIGPYAGRSISQWINPNAFADPGNNIGRFGDAQAGAVTGPGTDVVSMSLLKRVPLSETVRLEFGVQVANLFNHPNYAPPASLALGVPGFGQITSLQSAEGAGPRAMQLTTRVTF